MDEYNKKERSCSDILCEHKIYYNVNGKNLIAKALINEKKKFRQTNIPYNLSDYFSYLSQCIDTPSVLKEKCNEDYPIYDIQNTLNLNYKNLINSSNACYMNTSLQMVLNNKNLCNFIINNVEKRKSESFSTNKETRNNYNILLNISLFIKDYYNTPDKNPILAEYIINLFKDRFSITVQTDAEEFIRQFINILFYLLGSRNIYNFTLTTIKKNIDGADSFSTYKEFKDAPRIIDNILVLNIKDQNNTNLINLDASYKNYSRLNNFDEKLQQRIYVSLWPLHLIIQFKRFTGLLVKDTDEMEVPERWLDYKLTGFTCHLGEFGSGHYIYIGKHNNQWILFNDLQPSPRVFNLTKISELNEFNKLKNTGYLYYFETIAKEERKVRFEQKYLKYKQKYINLTKTININ
jgi:ubiquitin C-terminal hydrolase